jgi:ABC-type oligopeptide transport system substrate-binding subunit
MWMSNNGNNRTGWKEPRYDALMREANSQIDPKKRSQLLRQAETVLIREGVPVVPLYYYVGINFFDPKKIDGVTQNVLDEHPVSTIANLARHGSRVR